MINRPNKPFNDSDRIEVILHDSTGRPKFTIRIVPESSLPKVIAFEGALYVLENDKYIESTFVTHRVDEF
jgi:hypothetical protein